MQTDRDIFFNRDKEQFSDGAVNFVRYMKTKLIFSFSLFVLLLSSCERDVNFDLDETAPKLVVEASIENGQAPLVYLSNSVGFFSRIDPATLSANFVRNAQVFVSNGTRTHQLKEYSIPVPGGFNFYYYSSDPASPSTIFNGELGKSYTLRILADGKEYTASTNIPEKAEAP